MVYVTKPPLLALSPSPFLIVQNGAKEGFRLRLLSSGGGLHQLESSSLPGTPSATDSTLNSLALNDSKGVEYFPHG